MIVFSLALTTIQQDLKSSDLNMDDAVDLALKIDVYVWCYALLVVLARNDDDDLLCCVANACYKCKNYY